MKAVKIIGGCAEPCQTCRWVGEDGWCANGASIYFDHCRSDGDIPNPCPDWERVEEEQSQTAVAFRESVKQLGQYLAQLGRMMQTMQARMDELEQAQKQITITHKDVKDLGTLMKLRAREACEKYGLTDPADERTVKAAIKKAVLKRYGIEDLHDLPAVALQAVQKQIDHWADIRLMMKRMDLHSGARS